MVKGIVLALASFWIAGVAVLIVMSDSGSMSNPDAVFFLPVMAAVGALVGPMTFVSGVHGLLYGYGSGMPTCWAWFWIVLPYAGYLLLLAGVVVLRNPKLRISCLSLEALCALIAAKGVAYCI